VPIELVHIVDFHISLTLLQFAATHIYLLTVSVAITEVRQLGVC